MKYKILIMLTLFSIPLFGKDWLPDTFSLGYSPSTEFDLSGGSVFENQISLEYSIYLLSDFFIRFPISWGDRLDDASSGILFGYKFDINEDSQYELSGGYKFKFGGAESWKQGAEISNYYVYNVFRRLSIRAGITVEYLYEKVDNVSNTHNIYLSPRIGLEWKPKFKSKLERE